MKVGKANLNKLPFCSFALQKKNVHDEQSKIKVNLYKKYY